MKGGNVNKIKSILSAAAIVFSSGALADPDPGRQPIDQGIASTSKNLAKNPDNPGLPNALRHQIENQIRQSLHRAEVHDRAERVARVERVERPERPERPERVDFVSARDFGRAHRPERPDRPGKK